MLTFSETAGQQFAHTADMLTFSEAAGQQFAHTADMLTFSEAVNQHFNWTDIVLTFRRWQVTIYRVIYLQRSASFGNISRKLSVKYKFLKYKSKTFDNIKKFRL